MNADTRSRQLQCLGIAEGICMRLRQIINGEWSDKRFPEEYADMARTLSEIEDRLYGKGEYAPANAASTKGGAR